MKKFKIFMVTLLSILTLLSLVSCDTKEPADSTVEVTNHTVSFDSAGGSALPSLKIPHDSLLSPPKTPTREGYIFSRWMNGAEEWDFSYHTVTSDITLRAEWIDAGTVYERKNIGGGVAITAVKRVLSVMEIPSVIDGLPVLAIGDEAFADSNSDAVTKIIVADSVSSIGNNAFRNCDGIEIVIKGELTSVGEGAFKGCDRLANIKFGEGLETVSMQAFGSCTSLTNITLPSTVKLIDENAFEDCTALAAIALGNRLERIADSAFIGCDALDNVKFGGTEAEFSLIEIETNNKAFELAQKTYIE